MSILTGPQWSYMLLTLLNISKPITYNVLQYYMFVTCCQCGPGIPENWAVLGINILITMWMPSEVSLSITNSCLALVAIICFLIPRL